MPSAETGFRALIGTVGGILLAAALTGYNDYGAVPRVINEALFGAVLLSVPFLWAWFTPFWAIAFLMALAIGALVNVSREPSPLIASTAFYLWVTPPSGDGSNNITTPERPQTPEP